MGMGVDVPPGVARSESALPASSMSNPFGAAPTGAMNYGGPFGTMPNSGASPFGAPIQQQQATGGVNPFL